MPFEYTDNLRHYSWWTACSSYKPQTNETEESEEEKLEKKFKKLKDRLNEKGFISVGYLCHVIGFECDNQWDFYCGDKKRWKKEIIEKLYETREYPGTTKDLIEALHKQYKDGEED